MDWFREQKLLCPGCGLPRDETMDKEADGYYRARKLRCHACAARDRAARSIPADQSAGFFFGVERVNGA